MAKDIRLLDLKPNQKLLDASFDGYKLSLEPISKIKVPLAIPPHKILPSENQYSALHAQLFGLQNHLVRDPWIKNTTYFADANRNIQCVRYNEQGAKLDPLTSVYRLRQCHRSSEDYNISFTFVSEKYCVLTDGLGVLHVLDTGDRFNKAEWKSVYSDVVLEGSRQFFIEDARFDIVNETKNIYCVLLHIEHLESSFETLLNLISLKQDLNGVWLKTYVKEIKLKSLPTYCSLEPRSCALVVCTDRSVNLGTSDDNQMSALSKDNETKEKPISFTWTQLDDDISIKFQLSAEHEKCNFKVMSTDQCINVTYKNDTLLEGKLFGQIDSDLTTWSMENERTAEQYIQVTLVKKDNSNTKWTSLLADQHISDKADEDNTAEPHKYGLTSVLQSEIEDCDMDINDLDNDHNLLRIDTTTFSVTHKLNLGSNRPLFTLNQRRGALASIVIRSDVDALIWTPKFSIGNPSDWTLHHEATLNAFGYVQASKQQKKYIQCSPNADYAIICEPHRHVFIYKMSNSSAMGLKKRSGGKVSIGQQKLYSMEEQDEIVGMVVEDEITILLSEKYVFVLQINA